MQQNKGNHDEDVLTVRLLLGMFRLGAMALIVRATKEDGYISRHLNHLNKI